MRSTDFLASGDRIGAVTVPTDAQSGMSISTASMDPIMQARIVRRADRVCNRERAAADRMIAKTVALWREAKR